MKTTDSEIKKIIEALEANSSLKGCILEMIDASHDSSGTLNNGDDAEEAIVEIINKTGKTLLKEWTEKKSEEANSEALDQGDLRPHEKKK